MKRQTAICLFILPVLYSNINKIVGGAMLFYYQMLLVTSAIFTFWLISRWGRQISIFISLSVLLFPLINLCYLKLAISTTVSEALLCNGLIYILSFLMQFLFFLYVFFFCKIKLNPLLILSFFSIIFLWVYTVTLSKFTVGIFYKKNGKSLPGKRHLLP